MWLALLRSVSLLPLIDHGQSQSVLVSAETGIATRHDVIGVATGFERTHRYLYKAHRVRDAIDEVAKGEVLVFCDVDVQFFKPVKSTIEACMTDDLDNLLQSEFEEGDDLSHSWPSVVVRILHV